MASAAEIGTYKFDIYARIEGSAEHSLASKATSTTATAKTYNSAGNVQSSKSNYTVQLYKKFIY